MSTTLSRDEALSNFDQTREAFRRAIGQAPAECLGYLKEGDDYALGGIMYHVNAVLVHYRNALQAVLESRFSEVTPADPPNLFEEAGKKAKAGLDSPELARQLSTMDGLHAQVVELASSVPEADWDRKAPVHFEAGADAHPTACSDLLGWLSSHYEEHVPHIEGLIASWREGSPA